MQKTMVISIVLAMLQFMSSCTKNGALIGESILEVGSTNLLSPENDPLFDANCSGITTRDTIFMDDAAHNYFPYDSPRILTLKNENGQSLRFHYAGIERSIKSYHSKEFCVNADYFYERTISYAERIKHVFSGELPSGENIWATCLVKKENEWIEEKEEFGLYEVAMAYLQTPETYDVYVDRPHISEITWYNTASFSDVEEIDKEEEGDFVVSIELNGRTFENVRYHVNQQNYGIYINSEYGIVAIQTLREGLFIIV